MHWGLLLISALIGLLILCYCSKKELFSFSSIDFFKNNTKLEFVHIPKNAGTSIEKAAYKKGIKWGVKKNLGKRNLNQCSHHHDPDKIPEDKNTFAVVRDPYSRIVSNYNCPWVNPDCNKTQNAESLNKWIIDNLKKYKNDSSILDCHLIPQYDYVYNNNKKRITHILKYENLDKEFSDLMKTYNLDIELDKKKHNTKKCNLKVSDLYPETKQLIYNFYKKDFLTFNY